MEDVEPGTQARGTVKRTAGMMTHLRSLLAGSIDYAGLFPPASLGMDEAVQRYEAYSSSNHAWLLGRFVVPVSRLGECAASSDALPAGVRGTFDWKLSALAGTDLRADLQTVAAFNSTRRAGTRPALSVDTVEFKAQRSAEIEAIHVVSPGSPVLYAEIPPDPDPAELLRALAGAHMRAKIRTGGVTPDAFPSSAYLARFITGCVAAGVPFKATAGLHHPLRGRYRLTYADESPAGAMYGFLNVLVATALAGTGAPAEDVRRMLEEEDKGKLHFDAGQVRWGAYHLSSSALAATRIHFTAFGSCSFDEPVNDLQKMGLL
jgi:hypothetical protein